jgi:subtilisin family serine protease
MRRLIALVLVLAACADPSGPVQTPPRAAGLARHLTGSTHIVWSDVPGRAVSALARLGVTPNLTYTRALHGAAAAIAPADSVALVAAGVHVRSNLVVEAVAPVASWGIDRIDQRNLPLDNSYLPPNYGTGVTAYILDTGIMTSHAEFGGRASWGADLIDGTNVDCHGHGTHVAGTVGGATVGVANQAALVAVRVLNCAGQGTFEQVIAGIEWVTANAVKPAVANMSLGSYVGTVPPDEPLVVAVENSIASGVTYALAAGNNGLPACGFVAASHTTDAHAGFSNHGSCVDLYAPGVTITSAWINGGYNVLNGTSMAAPHVAGAAAQVLSANPTWSPAQVGATILANATPGVITSAPDGTPNLLLFVGRGSGEPPPVECPDGWVPRGNSGKCRKVNANHSR